MPTGVIPVSPKQYFPSSTGAPLVGGLLYVYLAGTTTASNTWQDKTLTTLNANPVVLDARGEATIWLDPTLTYKFVLKNSAGVTQYTVDNVLGAGEAPVVAQTTVDTFTGNGVTTAFNLSVTPTSEDATQVYISGVYQRKGLYSVAANVLTFASAPAAAANNIEVVTLQLVNYTTIAASLAAYETAAAASATAAAASATASGNSATASAASATTAANYLTVGTSASSVLIGTGAKSFTATTGKAWGAGLQLTISSAANSANYMHGTVTSYNSGTGALVMNILDIGGAGTLNDWTIAIAGTQGPTGATGATGPTGASAAPFIDSTAIIKGSSDATKLLRIEVDGFTTGTTRVATFPDKDGTVAMTSDITGPGDHYVTVVTGNGHGSTNTVIRRFTTTQGSAGTAITYTDSATLGARFTLAADGIYAVTYCDIVPGVADSFGVSINSAQLTTSIGSITAATRLVWVQAAVAGGLSPVSVCFRGVIGDVIRAHTNGTPTSTSADVTFTIRRISV